MILALLFDLTSVIAHRDFSVPHWLALLVAAILFVHVSYRVWRREWDRAEKNEAMASAFRKRLDDNCERLIDDWTALDADYLALPPPNGAKTLLDPLDSGWAGSPYRGDLLYNIGIQQGSFRNFEADLLMVKIALEDSKVRDIPRLLNRLRRYKAEISKLN